MAKTTIDYYSSEIIPDIYFFEEADATEFDTTLTNCLKSSEFLVDFKNAENQYASEAAVLYNIRAGKFHHNLTSKQAEDLIIARENGDDPDEGDYYELLMMYLYTQIHKR